MKASEIAKDIIKKDTKHQKVTSEFKRILKKKLFESGRETEKNANDLFFLGTCVCVVTEDGCHHVPLNQFYNLKGE